MYPICLKLDVMHYISEKYCKAKYWLPFNKRITKCIYAGKIHICQWHMSLLSDIKYRKVFAQFHKMK